MWPTNPDRRTEVREALLDVQYGNCAACGSDNPGPGHGWHLDHCHETNLVRGVLCQGCNFALGCAKDSIETLYALVEYLSDFEDYVSSLENVRDRADEHYCGD